ncbi:hypothetical protein HHI36_009831, partial [Cryptolaemus montrouzieri]
VRARIRRAKVDWYSQGYTEIEEFGRKHDMFNLIKKVKEVTGFQKRKAMNSSVDGSDEIISDPEEQLILWKEYVERLFADDRQKNHGLMDSTTGPSITKSEVEKDIDRAKNKKSTVLDELLKKH